MKKRLFVLFILAAAICLAGCRGGGEEQPPAPRTQGLFDVPVQLKDIPAPAGFEFVPNLSHVVQAGRLRPATTLVYRCANKNVPDTAVFYFSTMRELGWTPMGMNIDIKDQAILTFDNSKEICGVHINMVKDVVVVTIRIDCK